MMMGIRDDQTIRFWNPIQCGALLNQPLHDDNPPKSVGVALSESRRLAMTDAGVPFYVHCFLFRDHIDSRRLFFPCLCVMCALIPYRTLPYQ